MENSDFVKRLKSLMERKNDKGKKMTSYYLAKNIDGITSATIDKYLSGEMAPGPDKVKLLADFFRVSAGWLMYGEGQDLTFSNEEIVVTPSEMWDVLKASVYNQNAQNDHIGKLLDLLTAKLNDKKETPATGQFRDESDSICSIRKALTPHEFYPSKIP